MKKYFLFIFILMGVSSARAAEFDSAKAWDNLLAQCAFGPRNPSSVGHQKCLLWMESELKKYTTTVDRQVFSGTVGRSGQSLTLTNLVAHVSGKKPGRVLLCAHWDTRPWADQDFDPANRTKPILGANDGASGVAVLLEIARCLSVQKPAMGVDIALFDGEDLGREGHLDEYLQGSREYARNLKLPLPSAAILLDMVGDRDLSIPQEAYSLQYSAQVIKEIFDLALKLKEPAFDHHPGDPVYDDHIPLLEAGMQGVDLIDFNYPYWHTMQDTPENCSAQSLGSVGKVVLAWVYQQ
jgi:glutaminyl-peptide cyclotransferase